METVDFNIYLTKDEQRVLAQEANRMATELIFDADQLSTAVRLCFDNLRCHAVIEKLLTQNPAVLPECPDAPPEKNHEAFFFATSAEAVNAHPEAIFASLQMDFTGNVQLRSTNSPERALIVIIDNNVYPNPLYFTCLKGGTPNSELERLAPVFVLNGTGIPGGSCYLENIEPARADTENPRALRLCEKGRLDFAAL